MHHLRKAIAMEVPQKYGLFRVIAFILKLIAFILLAVFIIGGIWLMSNLGSGAGTWIGLAAMAEGVLVFLWFYGLGSVLTVLLDIEHKSRALAASSQA